ncbi:: CARDB [Gemmataceae bacterium]|jgi:hypothetical protein|nr:: CARDB [Gemmataceae bacterium]VTT97710.1 : CARDB [Gemmataceae bacterium]
MQFVRLAAGVLCGLGLLSAAGRGGQAPKAEKPDVIVSDLTVDGDDLVLEVQNQGPGAARKGAKVEAVFTGSTTTKVKDKATGKDKVVATPFSVTVPVPVPVEPLTLEKIKLPMAKLGVKEGHKLTELVTVTLDPKKTLAEERPGNNTFHRQLDLVGNQIKPKRAGYEGGTELPDLVVTDVVHDGPYLRVHYTNAGKGATGADFLIEVRSGKLSFGGNSYYRFQVPPPGEETKSGGFTLGLIGLKPGTEADVEVVIDPENRVRETDKKNNTFKKKVVIAAEKK